MKEEQYDPLRESGEGLFKEEGGNIWGWKFSYYSLAVILIFLALLMFKQLKNPNKPLFDEEISLPHHGDSKSD